MMLCAWGELPKEMRLKEVRPYYEVLARHKVQLVIKRCFDVITACVLLILLSPLFMILAIAIKLDSPGEVFYRQIRVGQYGKHFKIFKFRSMVTGADKSGSLVTVKSDTRVTRVGRFIRKYRLDEISQLIDVFRGTMTFVGTRPEVPKYVSKYTDVMMATLLLPPGVTSQASIEFKDEERLLTCKEAVEEVYVQEVLPKKMEYNLNSIMNFSIMNDISVMVRTVVAVVK